MGFIDKVKDVTKSTSEKVGNAIDCEKIDSRIREQEKKIEKNTKEIGDIVVACLTDAKDITMDEINTIYAKIVDAREAIEKLKVEKEEIKAKSKKEEGAEE